MGFFKKLFKGAKKIVKKTFKAIGSGLKKMWKNKWVRGIIIAAAVIGTGMWAAGALGASTVGAGAAGAAGSAGTAAAGAAAGATAGVGSAVGGAAGAGAAAGASAAAGTAAGAAAGASAAGTAIGAGTAAAANTGILGSIGSSIASGASAIGSGISSAAGWAAANPGAASILGGGIMQGASSMVAAKQAEDERDYQEKVWGRQGAFGISNDGSDQGGMGVTGRPQMMSSPEPTYRPEQIAAAPSNILGQPAAAHYGQTYAAQPYAPQQKQRLRFNPDSRSWENVA